jgi:PadR family transcriptional regulator, regulatory protein AphA
MLKYGLLGFLNYRSLSGYDLKRIMDASTANFWYADLSQIYKTLKALEADGAITSHIEPQEERPDRRVYSITDQGQEMLQVWLSVPLTETSPLKENLLFKLFFSGQQDPKQTLVVLRLQRGLHVQKLAQYQQQTHTDIEENASFMGATPQDALFWDATRRAGVLYEEMYIRWIDETIERLESLLK